MDPNELTFGRLGARRTGLDSPNFQGAIYATAVTKHLLENTVETGERVRHEELPHARKKRKFANLRSRCLRGKGRSAMDQVVSSGAPCDDTGRSIFLITAGDFTGHAQAHRRARQQLGAGHGDRREPLPGSVHVSRAERV